MLEDNWFLIDDVSNLDTPALVIYPERVKQNITILKSMVDDVARLRPHVKTNKCAEAVKLMLDAGITKFKCATIAEAEMLGICKAPDVLLAYQPVGPKLERFNKLIKAYSETTFSCLVDNLNVANIISDFALINEIQIRVYVDVNIGMNRTGIKPDETALQLYINCSSLKGIEVKGLHAYDGHIHDTDLTIRTQRCNESYGPVERLRDQIKQKGYLEPVIIAGGSPTYPIHAKRKNIECSPGTFIYWDRGYQLNCSEQPFLQASLVIGRVISLPDTNKICIDIGHKSVSAENELSKRIYFLNAPELKLIGQSEEHLVADAGEGHRYKVGDILYGLPWHICPTIALHERAITIDNKLITGEWKNVARDRKINI
jgi:D-serine deaminase-like pyridoxal phosphate-dependent protein